MQLSDGQMSVSELSLCRLFIVPREARQCRLEGNAMGHSPADFSLLACVAAICNRVGA